MLEDVACLVFFEHYLAEFVTQHDELKIVNILRKTLRKMSDRGRASARQLDLASSLESRGVGSGRLVECPHDSCRDLQPRPPA